MLEGREGKGGGGQRGDGGGGGEKGSGGGATAPALGGFRGGDKQASGGCRGKSTWRVNFFMVVGSFSG